MLPFLQQRCSVARAFRLQLVRLYMHFKTRNLGHRWGAWVPAKKGRSRLQLLWNQVEVVQDPVGALCI